MSLVLFKALDTGLSDREISIAADAIVAAFAADAECMSISCTVNSVSFSASRWQSAQQIQDAYWYVRRQTQNVLPIRRRSRVAR
jgi:hypothetical protein